MGPAQQGPRRTRLCCALCCTQSVPVLAGHLIKRGPPLGWVFQGSKGEHVWAPTWQRCMPARAAAAAVGLEAQRSAHPAAARCRFPLQASGGAARGTASVAVKSFGEFATCTQPAAAGFARLAPRTASLRHSTCSSGGHSCGLVVCLRVPQQPLPPSPNPRTSPTLPHGCLRACDRKGAGALLVRDPPRLLPQRHRADVQLLRAVESEAGTGRGGKRR